MSVLAACLGAMLGARRSRRVDRGRVAVRHRPRHRVARPAERCHRRRGGGGRPRRSRRSTRWPPRPAGSRIRTGRSTGSRRCPRSPWRRSGEPADAVHGRGPDGRAVVYAHIQADPLVARIAGAARRGDDAQRRARARGDERRVDGPGAGGRCSRRCSGRRRRRRRPVRDRSEAILARPLEVADRGEQARSQFRGAIVEAMTELLLASARRPVRRERRILFDGRPAEIHPYDVTVEREARPEAWDCKWGARGIKADVLHQLDDARRGAADEGEQLLVGLVVFDARRSCEVRLARATAPVARRAAPDHARGARPAGRAQARDVTPWRRRPRAVPYRVRFDECGPDGSVRTSALLRYAQDVAWVHSERLGFDRAWYAARGLGGWCAAAELGVLQRAARRDAPRLDPGHRASARSGPAAGRRSSWPSASSRPGDTDWVMTDARGCRRGARRVRPRSRRGRDVRAGARAARPPRTSARTLAIRRSAPGHRPDGPREQRGLRGLPRGGGAGDRGRGRAASAWSCRAGRARCRGGQPRVADGGWPRVPLKGAGRRGTAAGDGGRCPGRTYRVRVARSRHARPSRATGRRAERGVHRQPAGPISVRCVRVRRPCAAEDPPWRRGVSVAVARGRDWALPAGARGAPRSRLGLPRQIPNCSIARPDSVPADREGGRGGGRGRVADVQHAVAPPSRKSSTSGRPGRPPGPGRRTARTELLGPQLRDVAAAAPRGTRACDSRATSRRRPCASSAAEPEEAGVGQDARQVARGDVAAR